ncbi:hypothetical protein [Cellulomonas chengniuliangii]|uniref:Uncharacterized protein n=1 Tax=Cellulomonas chengniuliangii TaxID=2968084 RepID=A0ABY5L0U1_9CELL|nr:hypothetical protein [Cellulomonas chengniuliangii]MCC2307696.1 hypothetical protein [Cellulomonas chengniuliangii]MCC2318808.1 hypothetical protein [Cellulomonas chengniuliangii]UUI75543.1 hypothetical protein NP064_01030 [Cellulomonas chengniuliangii]
MTPTVEGFGTEITRRTYPVRGVPLMQTFYLRFSHEDRHIDSVGVEVAVPDTDTLTIEYFDESRDDEYFYKVQHRDQIDRRIIPGQIQSVAKARETRELGDKPSDDYVFVLSGFDFYFRGFDQHVDQIKLLESDGRLSVAFNDQDDKETFLWRAQYAWVPPDLILGDHRARGTRAHGGVRRAIPPGVPFIQGFNLDFRPYFTPGADHHLREIGVLTRWPTEDFMEIYYADRNGDDGFDWEVRLAYLADQGFTGPEVADLQLREFTAAEIEVE